LGTIILNNSDDLTGTQLGTWTLDKRIGVGGNGEVWIGKPVNENSDDSAIKVLRSFDDESKAQRRRNRFDQEISILKVLHEHGMEGVMPVLDHDHLQDRPWYAMPVGQSLDRTSTDDVVTWAIATVAQIAEIVSNLHVNFQTVHRDIKPTNVLLLNDNITLCDFGLALTYSTDFRMTLTGEGIGSRGYRAPEAHGHEVVPSPMADVYSLGKTLWSLLTDQEPPIPSLGDVPECRLRNQQGLEELEEIDSLLIAATQADPSQRPTAKQFAQGLRDYLIPTKTHVPPSVDPSILAKSLFSSSLAKNEIQLRKDSATKEIEKAAGDSFRDQWNRISEGMHWPKYTSGGGPVHPLAKPMSKESWEPNGQFCKMVNIEENRYGIFCIFLKREISNLPSIDIKIVYALSVFGEPRRDIEIDKLEIIDLYPENPSLSAAIDQTKEFAGNQGTINKILQRICQTNQRN